MNFAKVTKSNLTKMIERVKAGKRDALEANKRTSAFAIEAFEMEKARTRVDAEIEYL